MPGARKPKAPRRNELKPFKFMLQAVVLEVDGTGGIIAERPSNQVVVYGAKAAHEWIDTFLQTLPDAPIIDEPPPPVTG